MIDQKMISFANEITSCAVLRVCRIVISTCRLGRSRHIASCAGKALLQDYGRSGPQLRVRLSGHCQAKLSDRGPALAVAAPLAVLSKLFIRRHCAQFVRAGPNVVTKITVESSWRRASVRSIDLD